MTRVRGRTLPDGRRCKYSVPSPFDRGEKLFPATGLSGTPDESAAEKSCRLLPDWCKCAGLGLAFPPRCSRVVTSGLLLPLHRSAALRLAWYARYYSLQKARRGKSQHSWSTTHFNTAFAAPFSPTAVAAEASHLYRDHIFTLLRLVARRVILGRCERHQ